MANRREQILKVAAQLFAKHGYHGVSIAELGAAVGTSGPALYRHFLSKEALLEEMLVAISERLLAGGRLIERAEITPMARLEALIAFHSEFATQDPELIVVQDRDLANLAPAARNRVRRLQRTYVEIWVDVLRQVSPGLSAAEARPAAHATLGLLNSTPHAGRGAQAAALLRRMALAALVEAGTTP